MSHSSAPKKRSLAAILGGLILAGVAAWFGLGIDGDIHQTAQVAGGVDTRPVPADGDHPACGPAALPDQADLVVEDILTGGPYTHPENDGTRFGNYEGVLPDEQLGFYREYTVDTPGLSHRGERRIVTGGGTESDPEVWYYSDDHYESFCEIPHAEN